jgi:hypothetical protein
MKLITKSDRELLTILRAIDAKLALTTTDFRDLVAHLMEMRSDRSWIGGASVETTSIGNTREYDSFERDKDFLTTLEELGL